MTFNIQDILDKEHNNTQLSSDSTQLLAEPIYESGS